MASLFVLLEAFLNRFDPPTKPTKVSTEGVIHILDFKRQCEDVPMHLIEAALEKRLDFSNTCFVINCPENINAFVNLK
jgi:hypothetical protein